MDALDNNHESYYGLGGAKPSTAESCRLCPAIATSAEHSHHRARLFLFFAGIAVISNVYANATTTWLTTTVFVGFALLALPIVGDYFAARHEVSEEGLRYGRLFGAGGQIRWADLKKRSVQRRDEMVSP